MKSIAIIAFCLGLWGCGHVDLSASMADDQAAVLDEAKALLQNSNLELGSAIAEEALSERSQAILAGGPIGMDDAVALAFLHDRRLWADFERLKIARADLATAGLLRNPSLQSSFLFFDRSSEIQGMASTSLTDLIHRPRREAVAQNLLSAEQERVIEALVAKDFSVRMAFLNLASARAEFTLREKMADVQTEILALNRALFAAGNANEEALARVELTTAQSQLAKAEANASLVQRQLELEAAIGWWPAPSAPSFDLPKIQDWPREAATEDLEHKAIAVNKSLAQSAKTLEALAEKLGLAHWEGLLPSGQLGIAGMREPSGQLGLGPSFQLELPIFNDGSTQKARIAAELREQLALRHAMAVDIRNRARMLKDRSAMVDDQLRYTEETLIPLAAKLVQRRLETYNAMQIGAPDVLVEKIRELEIRRQSIALKRERSLISLEIRALLAGHAPKMTMMAAERSPMDSNAMPAGGDH